MNGQNNNSNGKVKNKFFNQDLFDSANVNEVGSSTSGQVISWGVGGNKKSAPDVSNLSVLDSTQMFNFVNTEVTDFVENNSYSNNVVQDNNQSSGLFDGSQFMHSMQGEATITDQVVQNDYTTNVEDVFVVSKFDDSVNNSVSNEFAQAAPVFTGYNANPDIIVQNNGMVPNGMNVPVQNNDMMQNGMNEPVQNEIVSYDNFAPVVEQNAYVANQEVNPVENTIVAPVFDPFNGGAEPVTPFVQEVPTVMEDNNVDFQMQQNSPLFAMAAESQVSVPNFMDKELVPLNVTANDGEINDEMRTNQPLSLMALSGESIDEAQKPKDVVENSKYFQATPLEDNRLNVEEIVSAPIAPVVDILAEPVRDVNFRELTQAFVGDKYGKISMSPFSFCGALFSSMYFFYRKMIVEGLILVILNFFIMFALYKSYVIGLGLALGEFIVIGLLTNPIYLSFVDRQVKTIAYKNPKLSQYELQKICQLKGGTSFGLCLLIGVSCNVLTCIILNNTVGQPSFLELYNPSKINLKVDTDASLEEVVEYELPTDFKRVKTGEVPFVIEETVKKKGKELHINSCGFNIYLVGGHDTSKDLVTYMAEKDQRYNRVGTYKTLNEEVWDTYEYDGDEYYYYYRARKFNGHIVLVSYAKHMYSTEGMCDLHLENIMNSIKEKKKE
jgi:hypothetical protein